MFVLVSFVPNGYAAGNGDMSIQPETVQIILSMAGLETELVDLAREDVFDRALYTDTLGSDPLLIGFPGKGIGKGFPFLLAVEGEEIVFLIAEDGGLQVVSGNEAVIPAGVIDAVECLVGTLLDLIQDILDASLNPFSIIALVLNAVFSILFCVFALVF
jgi:hypothetical protein